MALHMRNKPVRSFAGTDRNPAWCKGLRDLYCGGDSLALRRASAPDRTLRHIVAKRTKRNLTKPPPGHRIGISTMAQARKTALVTGGAKRIGKAIVEDLAAHGFAVAIHCNRSRAEADALARAVRDGLCVVYVFCV